MRRSFLLAICLSAAAAFAGAYDISEFSAQDKGTPDKYIAAEFGGQLKTAPADEVATLQKGRLVIRQKFEDPFGDTEPTYQLYQGRANDLSNLVALTPPEGMSYSSMVTTKFYATRGMQPKEDAEKVYFDGTSIYIPGLTSAFAIIDGKPVELQSEASKAEAAAASAPAATSKKKCDEYEYDPDCDDDEDLKKYDVSGNLNRSNAQADAINYSTTSASSDVTSRFGIADEVRFWSAVALTAVAVGSAVMGIVQQKKSSEAKDAADDLGKVADIVDTKIDAACSGGNIVNKNACVDYFKNKATAEDFAINTSANGFEWTYAGLQSRINTNKDTQNSYATARNIWFGVSALSLTAAIVLYVW